MKPAKVSSVYTENVPTIRKGHVQLRVHCTLLAGDGFHPEASERIFLFSVLKK